MGAPTRALTHTHDAELLEYFEETLPDQDAQGLEEHLAVCDLCTTRAREVYAFHELWNRWTAAEHGRAYQQALVTRALRTAEGTSIEWTERLRRWRTRWNGLAEAALQVRTQLKSGTAEVIARGLDTLRHPGSAWALQPVLENAFVRGDITASHDLAEFATAAVAGRPSARVEVRAAERGEVTIRIDGLESAADAPLAVLVPVGASSDAEPRVTQAVRASNERFFIARFVDMPAGEYVVLIEPLGQHGPEETPLE